jgi:hypothetical protein
MRKKSSILIVASCLGVYAILAAGFHWLLPSAIGKTPEVPNYQSLPANAAIARDAALAPAPSPTLSATPTSLPATAHFALAARASAPEKAANEVPKEAPKKHVAKAAPRHEREARHVRERRNSWDFASGSYGSRPWF